MSKIKHALGENLEKEYIDKKSVELYRVSFKFK